MHVMGFVIEMGMVAVVFTALKESSKRIYGGEGELLCMVVYIGIES